MVLNAPAVADWLMSDAVCCWAMLAARVAGPCNWAIGAAWYVIMLLAVGTVAFPPFTKDDNRMGVELVVLTVVPSGVPTTIRWGSVGNFVVI